MCALLKQLFYSSPMEGICHTLSVQTLSVLKPPPSECLSQLRRPFPYQGEHIFLPRRPWRTYLSQNNLPVKSLLHMDAGRIVACATITLCFEKRSKGSALTLFTYIAYKTASSYNGTWLHEMHQRDFSICIFFLEGEPWVGLKGSYVSLL